MLEFLIDNKFVIFGGRVFQQTVGILFQAQWDRCDQRNHQTLNYLVKGHHLYSGT
jgi:hypothetical protein